MGQSSAITSLKNNRSLIKKRSDLSVNALKKSNEKKEDLIDPKKATPEQLAHIRMEQEEYKRQQFYKKIIVFMVAGTLTVVAAIVVIYILREIFEF